MELLQTFKKINYYEHLYNISLMLTQRVKKNTMDLMQEHFPFLQGLLSNACFILVNATNS